MKNKLNKFDDLMQALALLKIITEQSNADFHSAIYCNDICNLARFFIFPLGFEVDNNVNIILELDLEENADNTDVLKNLHEIAKDGIENHSLSTKAKNEALSEKRLQYEKLKAEFEPECEAVNG